MAILLANWDIVLLVILLVIFVVFRVKHFLAQPSEKRQELILLWLIEAVAIAEKRYGSKTGSLKLSYVYSMFLKRFGGLARFISKEIFEKLVDQALKILDETLKNKLEEKQSD